MKPEHCCRKDSVNIVVGICHWKIRQLITGHKAKVLYLYLMNEELG